MTPLPTPRGHRLRIVAVAAGSFLILACGGASDAPDSTHEFTISEENGITVARTTGGPKYEGEIFSYEKVLEIRPDEGRPETLFFLPTGLELDDEENLYVVDANGNRISVFDRQGGWLRDIGRQGDGPGEFQYPTTIEYVDGVLRVRDTRKRGTHIFARTGDFIEFERWPEFTRVGSLVPEIWPTPTGGTVVRLLADSQTVARLEERTPDDLGRESIRMLVFDEEGGEAARVDGPWVKTGEYRTYTRDGREARSQVPVYFSPQTWGGFVDGRGIWVSPGDSPRIDWYDLDGRPVARWEIDLPTVPVTDEDRALVQELLDEQVQAAVDPAPGQEQQPAERLRLFADNALFADSKPLWGIPRPDSDGFLWLGSQPPARGSVGRALAEQDDARRFFRVLSPSGEYLGDTRPPSAGTVVRGHLLSIATDPETEELYPVVYRIRPAVEGLEYGR